MNSPGAARRDRRAVAALVAALGLLWTALALSNLGHVVAYVGSELVVLLASLPTGLFLLAAAGLWMGKRWAWAVVLLAMLVSVCLVGMVGIGVYGSSD